MYQLKTTMIRLRKISLWINDPRRKQQGIHGFLYFFYTPQAAGNCTQLGIKHAQKRKISSQIVESGGMFFGIGCETTALELLSNVVYNIKC